MAGFTPERRKERKNIFAGMFSALHLGSLKVQIGILVVIALLVVSIVVGSKYDNVNVTPGNGTDAVATDHKGNFDDIALVKDAAEKTNYAKDDDKYPVATEETTAVTTEEAADDTAIRETTAQTTEPDAYPKTKSNEEIGREIDKETNIAESNEVVHSVATVEQMPQFPGGDTAMYTYLSQHIVYPADALEEGARGRVIVQFTVSKTGEITNVSIVRGKHPSLDREAVRVVKSMPVWIPGKQSGRPVNVMLTLPIIFNF